MSVVAEFTIASDQFILGQVLSRDPRVHIEIERVVPASRRVMPYIWVEGEDFEEFEERVTESPHVRSITALDRVDLNVLYKVVWDEEVESLIHGIAATDATILEARGNEDWTFRIRFEDHSGLADFHNYCVDHDITFQLNRVYTLTQRTRAGYTFGLTEPQREALVYATKRGYFEVPRKATLDDLSEELDISQQALSERIRRGTDKVLRNLLLEPGASDLR